jgi:hypothetical protein
MTTIFIQRFLAPQDSCTLYILAERHNAIQPTIIHNLFFLQLRIMALVIAKVT